MGRDYFIIFVIASIALNAKIDYDNNEHERNIDTLIQKIDSLKCVTAYQFDSIMIMPVKLQKTVNIGDSIKQANNLFNRPLVKIIEANVFEDGGIELKLVNDGNFGATNIQGDYAFILKSLIDNTDKKITQKQLPFLASDILTKRDDFIRINIPPGIFDCRRYIDQNWIYLVVDLIYSDILSKKEYAYQTTMRLRKLDNGKFNGGYEYEHVHYIKFIK